MESVAYILVLTMALAVLFFAIAFREPPASKNSPIKGSFFQVFFAWTLP